MAAGPTAIPKFRCPPLRINPAFRIAKPSNFISKGTSYFEISIYGLVERRYHDLDHEHDYGAESGSSQDYKVRICAFRIRTERWPKSRGSGRNRRFVRHPTSPTTGLYLSRKGGRTDGRKSLPFLYQIRPTELRSAEDTASCCSNPSPAVGEREERGNQSLGTFAKSLPACASESVLFPRGTIPAEIEEGAGGGVGGERRAGGRADGWIWSSGFGQMSAKPEWRGRPRAARRPGPFWHTTN